MADNGTAASGPTIAWDDIGGVAYQRVKVVFGADGAAADVNTGSGLPVTVQGTVPVSGTFWQATQPVSAASLPLPAGAALDASVTALSAKFGALGQAAMVGAAPVVIASNQSAIPVSGTFWQSTQPISAASLPLPTGAATETTLAALNTKVTAVNTGAVTISAALPAGTNVIGALTANQSVNNAQIAGVATATGNGVVGTGVQRVAIASDNSPVAVTGTFNPSPTPEASATFRGRASTFRTPGRAGTTGQKIFALHNATGSTKVVHINQIAVDLYQTVVKAITVAPPIIRVHRFTAVPTNGTALTKVSKDTALTTNASITSWGDASADGTSSASALTVTIPANSILTQEFAARFITAAGYEMMDRAEFLDGKDIVLRALEGVVVELVYTAATQNPITDMWVVSCDWWEI